MRGVAYEEFGGPEVLILRDDLPDPPVGPDTVLVRVHASSVNPVDLVIRQGYLAGAYPHHFPIIPGWDVAGVVEAAGVPLAGLTAYQALTEALDVHEGQRVLVHRAAGGVGFFAVQIAVALGAQVIGTASPRNHGFLRDAGAAEVLDYSAGPISQQLAEPVDAVLDLVGGDALADAPAQVRDRSRIVSVVDPSVNGMGGRYVFVRPEHEHLEELARMADAGQLRVPIAKAFPLEQTAAAQELVAHGHVRGKVVVTVR
jgi:NADPH:quinone reductase-like Zn-dependent oxidoreductase